MTAENRPLRTARRFIMRTLLTVAGVIVGLFFLFLCGNMFAGYPRYHSALLSIIAMILIALTGGLAWIIDERRIDADG
jgi:uncharacterized protein YhhL (DUF1145 family)